jgi:hypothetical protein
MSSDSLALFRKSMGNELGALAEQHYQHEQVPLKPERFILCILTKPTVSNPQTAQLSNQQPPASQPTRPSAPS